MHDAVVMRAAETLDRRVYEDVRNFHNLTNAVDLGRAGLSPIFSACTPSDLALFEYGWCSSHPSINAPNFSGGGARNRSASGFCPTNNVLGEEELLRFLSEAFGQSERQSCRYRPYPSAGALYPIHVFAALRLKSTMFRCVAFNPHENSLMILKDAAKEEILSCFILESESTLLEFCFVLLYTIFPMAVLSKYYYRGYRHALMECGAMYQNASLEAKSFGFASRVFSGFEDVPLACSFGIDGRAVWPVIVQFFGYPPEGKP